MKKRRSFLKKASLLFLGLGSLSFKPVRQTKDLGGSFVHMVFFWLKEPANKDSREKFEMELRNFIDNTLVIRNKHIGIPADTNRPVVDNTYTYSLVVTFESREDYDVYADHPLHLRFIENAQDLWERVQVYDSVLI